jgi:pimeloyl-ACP methyl ester carboxylesterase
MSATIIATVILGCAGVASADDVFDKVEHGFADNDGVKIHYAALGEGPVIIMIHGFPDFWYSWRHQMAALSSDYKCVAVDQRGYNKSGQPKGIENYEMKFLVSDIAAVVKSLGEEKVIIMGHDWGGMVAWQFALTNPDLCEKLIILNLPHPRGLSRELAKNEEQAKNSAYARNFQKEGAHKSMTGQMLAGAAGGKDPEVRERYVEAFNNSDIEAMLAYYKMNYPREPYQEDPSPVIKTEMPVLIFHGLGDTALLAPALNNTWDWMGKHLTIVTVPESGHWVQHDAADLVSNMTSLWLQLEE